MLVIHKGHNNKEVSVSVYKRILFYVAGHQFTLYDHKNYKKRLKSFKDYHEKKLAAYAWVKAGFTYDNVKDVIRCDTCKLTISSKKLPEDCHPYAVHQMSSRGRCPCLSHVDDRMHGNTDSIRSQGTIYICFYLLISSEYV